MPSRCTPLQFSANASLLVVAISTAVSKWSDAGSQSEGVSEAEAESGDVTARLRLAGGASTPRFCWPDAPGNSDPLRPGAGDNGQPQFVTTIAFLHNQMPYTACVCAHRKREPEDNHGRPGARLGKVLGVSPAGIGHPTPCGLPFAETITLPSGPPA